MRRFIYTLYFAICLSGTSVLQAQGIFSTSELNRSPRSIAMGGITSVSGSNAFSVYENASATAFSDKKAEAGIMYSPWAQHATQDMDRNNLLVNAAAYYSLSTDNKLLLGISYFVPGGNDIFPTDAEGNVSGDKLKPKYMSIHAGYARHLSSSWGISAVLSYANWNPGLNGNANAVSLDLGTTYRLQLKPEGSYMDMALKAAGWGATIADEGNYKLPGNIAAGIMWHRPFAKNHQLNLGAEANYRCLDEPELRASIGGEYGYHDILFARCGYSFSSHYSKLNSYATVGAGVLLLSRVQLDFSYLLGNNESPFKNTFAIGINVLF